MTFAEDFRDICRKRSGNLQKIIQNIAENHPSYFLKGRATYRYLYGMRYLKNTG